MRDIWNNKTYWSFENNEWIKKIRVYVLSGNTLVGEENLKPLTYKTLINVDASDTTTIALNLTYDNVQTYPLSVDWGDIGEKEIVQFSSNGYAFYHTYSTGMYEMNVIYPENISGFFATGCSITNITNLADSVKILNLENNKIGALTSLNLPTKLVYLDLYNNTCDTTGIDDIIYYITNNYSYFNYLDVRMSTLAPASPLAIELFSDKFPSCSFFHD